MQDGLGTRGTGPAGIRGSRDQPARALRGRGAGSRRRDRAKGSRAFVREGSDHAGADGAERPTGDAGLGRARSRAPSLRVPPAIGVSDWRPSPR